MKYYEFVSIKLERNIRDDVEFKMLIQNRHLLRTFIHPVTNETFSQHIQILSGEI